MNNVDTVDKIEQLSFDVGVKAIKKKRRSTITLDLDKCLVGLHFLSLPFAVMGKNRNIGTLEVRWTDSNNIKHGIDVLGSSKYGVPNYFDKDTLIGLFKLYSEENDIINYNYNEKSYNMPIIINYSFSELARAMNLSTSGNNIKRLQDSIRRLKATTLINKCDGGIYDPIEKIYITDAEKGYGILDYEMYRYVNLKENEKRLSASNIKDKNFVKIDPFFYSSMCSGYFRIINYNYYQGLKQGVAKRLYSLLEAWGGKSSTISSFHYFNTLYDWIPLDKEQSISLKNRYIKDAAEELGEIGYINKYEILDQEKGRGINLIFDDSKYDVNKTNVYGLDKYKTFEDATIRLIELGFNQDDINVFYNQRDIEYIKALLRLLDIKIQYNQVTKSPKGWLVKGISTLYNIDEKYYTSHSK